MRRIRRRSFFVWPQSQRISSRWFDEIGLVTTSPASGRRTRSKAGLSPRRRSADHGCVDGDVVETHRSWGCQPPRRRPARPHPEPALALGQARTPHAGRTGLPRVSGCTSIRAPHTGGGSSTTPSRPDPMAATGPTVSPRFPGGCDPAPGDGRPQPATVAGSLAASAARERGSRFRAFWAGRRRANSTRRAATVSSRRGRTLRARASLSASAPAPAAGELVPMFFADIRAEPVVEGEPADAAQVAVHGGAVGDMRITGPGRGPDLNAGIASRQRLTTSAENGWR